MVDMRYLRQRATSLSDKACGAEENEYQSWCYEQSVTCAPPDTLPGDSIRLECISPASPSTEHSGSVQANVTTR